MGLCCACAGFDKGGVLESDSTGQRWKDDSVEEIAVRGAWAEKTSISFCRFAWMELSGAAERWWIELDPQ